MSRSQLFEKPLNLCNKLLDPSLILEASAIVAYHEQINSTHLLESLDWMLDKFLPRFLQIVSLFSNRRFQVSMGWTGSQASPGCTTSSNQQPPSISAVNSPSSHSLVDLLSSCIASIRNLCLLFGRQLTKTRIRGHIKDSIGLASGDRIGGGLNQQAVNEQSSNQIPSNPIALYTIQMAVLTAFEPIEQSEFDLVVSSLSSALSLPNLSRCDIEILASGISIMGGSWNHIQSPSSRQKFLGYTLDAVVSYAIKQANISSQKQSASLYKRIDENGNAGVQRTARNKLVDAFTGSAGNQPSQQSGLDANATIKAKENVLILFRHILTCLIDPVSRPTDWAHILVSKFLPTLISLANDSSDVYTCTYARLMCAKLVETFDTYFNDPKLSRAQAEASLPDLESLRALTKQIQASNLRRQIECLLSLLHSKFFNNYEHDIADNVDNNNNINSNNDNDNYK